EMQKKTLHFPKAIVALAVVTLLSSCRQEAAKPAAAGKPALEPVIMNSGVTSLGFSPMMIANDSGFFAAEGIELKFADVDSNSAVLALVSGKIDVLNAPIRSGLFTMIAKKPTIQVVADRGHSGGDCMPEAWVAPAKLADQ